MPPLKKKENMKRKKKTEEIQNSQNKKTHTLTPPLNNIFKGKHFFVLPFFLKIK